MLQNREIRIAGKIIAGILSTTATGILTIGMVVALPYLSLSQPTQKLALAALQPASERTLILHDAYGDVFARRGGCVAERVSLAEVPDHFIEALLSMEDRRFYSHFGVDLVGLLRAAFANHKAGRVVQGGSTITQQLVKYSLLSSEKTIQRKKEEAWLALALELRLSKQEILEYYLSSAYFGEGCFGLRAAAKEYFRAPVNELTLAQSVYLVALLKSPSDLAQNSEAARRRANLVLDAMVENDRLSSDRRAQLLPAVPQARSSEEVGSFYADWVAKAMTVPRNGDFSPLPVYTSFDPRLQHFAQQAVEDVLGKKGKKHHASQAAMVVMRPDGRVLAMVGGTSHDSSQFNRAVQARRQPGSAFKLFVYLAALRGGLSPDSTVIDRPIRIGNYEPKNFDHRYRGAISVRRAFASSINTVAVQLSEAVGRQPVIDAARDLGISAPLNPQPSLALGAFEVNLLELTGAYAAISAGAYPVRPWAITGFESSNENNAPPTSAGQWRLKEQNELLTLLKGTVDSGSGRGARLPVAAYGKTGTSQNYRDAWFIGFAGNLVVGVWVGNDDYTPMKRVTGGSLPAEIWATFMRAAIDEDEEFQRDLPVIVTFPALPRSDRPLVSLASDVHSVGADSSKHDADDGRAAAAPREIQRERRTETFKDRGRKLRRDRRRLFGGLFR